MINAKDSFKNLSQLFIIYTLMYVYTFIHTYIYFKTLRYNLDFISINYTFKIYVCTYV